VYRFKNGTVYEGLWEYGNQHGDGTLTRPYREAARGLWQNGEVLEWYGKNNTPPRKLTKEELA